MEIAKGLVVVFFLGWWFIGLWWTIAITGSLSALVIFGAWSATKEGADQNINAPPSKKNPDGGFNVNARLKIRYTSADGENTEREIRAHRYIDSSPGYVEAWCMKASAARSFRTDRIKSAIDMDTGEVIKRMPTFMRSKRSQ